MDLESIKTTAPKVQAFLAGNGEPPIEEFIFIHNHPMLQDNFVTDINKKSVMAGNLADKLSGGRGMRVVRRMETLTNSLLLEMSKNTITSKGIYNSIFDADDMSISTALKSLNYLRDMNMLCDELLALMNLK